MFDCLRENLIVKIVHVFQIKYYNVIVLNDYIFICNNNYSLLAVLELNIILYT